MTGLEWLLAFAIACAVALAVEALLEHVAKPPAPVEHFTPLAELYIPRHAAPIPAQRTYTSWEDPS